MTRVNWSWYLKKGVLILVEKIVTPGRVIMGRLKKGDDLLSALTEICVKNSITAGEVRAIGAVTKARVGYYKQQKREYTYISFAEPLEIISLVGNISLKDKEPFVHAHITLMDEEGHSYGGHLAPGTEVFACEYIIQEYHTGDQGLNRVYNEKTGLALWEDGK
ncbi:MAG: DNA-binding protein [Peptococcaceae bacterium]|nr:DNA-binding protein [Peptococcaceae bacterium]